MNPMVIRSIVPGDDRALAKIIRDSLSEFGADKPGTVYFDPTTDHLSDLFRVAGSVYLVAETATDAADTLSGQERSPQIAGGAGVFPTPGLPEKYCELVKLYLAPVFRGQGLGSRLIRACFVQASELGYSHIYLETMPELHNAIGMYQREGFRFLDGPMGQSGHFGCDLWMIKNLK